MARTNYNGTATASASKTIAEQNAGRTSFFFKSLGADFVLNFGADASASNVLSVKAGESVLITNSHKEPYDCRAKITVYCASASNYQAQAEE